MDSRIKELLRPELVSTMDGLELIARTVVEGFMSGSNRSQSIGSGQEFSQYRNYEPGDDLRQLDWKMYARSERYFIKQAEIETNITVKFMIDASKSMAHQESGISKIQYAKVLTAALAYLARRQGDTFGLYAISESQVHIVHPKFEQQQFMWFFHALVEIEAQGKWHKSNNELLFDHHGKELIIFLTDLYDDADDLYQFISRLKTTRNEVVILHIVGERELTLDYNGSFTFKDLESGEIVKVETLAQKAAYGERIAAWIDQTRSKLLERNVSYQRCVVNEHPENALVAFLKSRKLLSR